MLPIYHRQITLQALQHRFSPSALQVVLRGNLGQDSWRGQIGHPEFHFDDSCFSGGQAYLQLQRELIQEALAQGQAEPAWLAFGRLTHAAQDFYAHSNYVRLWARRFLPQALDPTADLESQAADLPPSAAIEPLDPELLKDPQLASGRIYYPWEILAYLPGLKKLALRLLPHDSHTWMNLDTPDRGPLFAYACTAAEKRTLLEWESIYHGLSSAQQRLFSDLEKVEV